jgi:hypothetical protein
MLVFLRSPFISPAEGIADRAVAKRELRGNLLQ